MRCSKCGTNNPSTNNFCAKCGNALAKQCAKCKAENPPTSDFCGKCGTPLTNGAGAAAATSSLPGLAPSVRVAPESGSPETLEGERKTVTALFADIKGSTELEQDLDPEEARAIIDPALKLMIDAAHRYDGYIVQSTGDGIFALFGAPVAHEDHPQRALYAALRMQEELKRYSARLREAGNLPLEARVGVNTGEVVVRSITTGQGQTEYTPIGHTTNLASRMQALAPTGSIAISEPTRKLVEGYFALKPLGPTKVKGVSEPVNVYEVTGLGPLRTRLQRSAGRGLSKFVGRQAEMDSLKRASEQAKAGRGQIVAAMAEAGVGKSRLLFEFKAKNQSGWMVLETFSVSHGKASAFFPVIDLLHNYFKIEGEDDQRGRRAKVTGNVLTLDRALEDTLPYLFALLSIVEGDDPLAQMDGQVKKRRTLEAIKRVLLRESLNQPLMVIFEDLHWIDDETQALLNLLADSIGTAKILLLVNYRPEYSHQWNSKTYYTQLRLDPLGKESADEMLSALLGDGAELAPLKRVIIEKTEGNPFFMEETVQVLLDEGALVREGSAVRLTRPLAELKIPPTVQGILAARIDRLPADEKDLLQTLAVIGKEFSLSLVRAVLHPHPPAEASGGLSRNRVGEALEGMLGNLQLAEFIYEQPAVGDTEYTFKHALTQEVSYNSVLIERRKQLHERAGSAIETLFRDQLEDFLASLAFHYGRSANAIKAAEYFGRAGEQSMERSAYSAAAASVEDGLKQIGAIPEGAERARLELRLQILSGQVHQMTASIGSTAAAAAFSRARDLCAQLGDDQELFYVLDGLRWACLFNAEIKRARDLAEEQLAIAKRSDDPAKLVMSIGALGEVAVWMGDFVAARGHLEQLAAMSAKGEAGQRLIGRNLDVQVIGLSLLESTLLMMGFADQAASRRDATLAWASGLSQGYATFVAWHIAGISALRRRSASAALEYSQRAIDEATEQGLAYAVAIATVINGCARSFQGQDEGALEQMRRGIELAEAAGSISPTWLLLPLAEECARFGRTQECAELIEKLFERVEMGQRWEEAEIFRVKGEMLLMQGGSHATDAEQCLRKAVEIARNQSAKFLELRATVSLARLLDGQGKRDEARAMLAEIYGWFTEGFDTADLRDAKALLDELGG
jgi:class 3 adenylate cyclase/tetratricopeptide (TPR) repeat protein/ribosomal protein L40E